MTMVKNDIYKNKDSFIEYQRKRREKYGINGTLEVKVDGKTNVLRWTDRHVAVGCFIFAYVIDYGKWYVLANKRGCNTPDYQDMWNAPCGYLEKFETAQEGCTRETMEETTVYISPMRFIHAYTETEPANCNHGNVTLRHIAVLPSCKDVADLPDIDEEYLNKLGGESSEVSGVMWIAEDDVINYCWAFGHMDIIKEFITVLRNITNKVEPEKAFYNKVFSQGPGFIRLEPHITYTYDMVFGDNETRDKSYKVEEYFDTYPSDVIKRGLGYDEAIKLRNELTTNNKRYKVTYEVRKESDDTYVPDDLI